MQTQRAGEGAAVTAPGLPAILAPLAPSARRAARAVVAVFTAAVVGAALACGGGGGGGDGGSTGPKPIPTSASVSALPSLAFAPNKVDIQANGSVTWNFGAVEHNVHFTTAGAPDSIPLTANGAATRTFPTAGTYQYRCLIHPGMAGSVVVH